MSQTIKLLKDKILHVRSKDVVYGDYTGYNGEKRTWKYNDVFYMIKSREHNQKPKTNFLNQEIDSYNNSILSEYVGSHIINSLGYINIKAQQTILVWYEDDVWVACQHLSYNHEQSKIKRIELWEFATISKLYKSLKIKYHSEFEYRNRSLDFSVIEEWINQQFFIDQQLLSDWFYDMFMIDAFLLNWDRNPTNWGLLHYISNDMTSQYAFAPLYDQGSCLLSKDDSNTFEHRLNTDNSHLIQDTITLTKSYFSDSKHGFIKKLNYQDYLRETTNFKVIDAMKRFVDTIDINKVISTINSLVLPQKFKDVYIDTIKRSYLMLINSINKNKTYKKMKL